eukprot:g14513.t1
MASPSYLTRRQRSYAASASHNNPHSLDFISAALVPNHERGTLPTSQGGVGRSRRRGSPFAALSEAYKPPRAAVFARPGGRDGGEVLGLRSSNFAWPKAVESLPTDPRHVQRQREEAAAAEMEVTSRTKKPVLPLVRKKTDASAVESRWVSSSAAAQESRPAVEPAAAAIPSTAAASAAAAAAAAAPTATTTTTTAEATPTPTSPPTHRRTVSWGKAAVYRFEISVTQTQADVYSPDLHAVEIAKRLAMMVRDPELRRAAMAVENCRRHSASIVRSLTSKQNGGVDGVEEACRVYNWREAAFLRETDELVRSIVVGTGEEKVWRLKASYRAARRQMEDASSV